MTLSETLSETRFFTRGAAEDSEQWCILRTAHDDESIVRPFAFHRERSEAFDDQLTAFSQKNYRAAQYKFFEIQNLFVE